MCAYIENDTREVVGTPLFTVLLAVEWKKKLREYLEVFDECLTRYFRESCQIAAVSNRLCQMK